MKSVFLKLEKEKKKRRPKVFEEDWRVFRQVPSLQSASRVQQKKVSGVCQISLYALFLSYIYPMMLHPVSVPFKTGLHCIQVCFHQSFGERWRGEEQQWRGEWREEEGESSAVFTVWSLRGVLLPRPAPDSPPLESGQCSRVRESRPGGGDLWNRRRGGWLCQSPGFSSQTQAPPHPPRSSSSEHRRRRRSIVRKNKKKGGRHYGDCVAGLLWAELGDRLGLQLPGGGPLARLPAAPLSRPSEFSSIS